MLAYCLLRRRILCRNISTPSSGMSIQTLRVIISRAFRAGLSHSVLTAIYSQLITARGGSSRMAVLSLMETVPLLLVKGSWRAISSLWKPPPRYRSSDRFRFCTQYVESNYHVLVLIAFPLVVVFTQAFCLVDGRRSGGWWAFTFRGLQCFPVVGLAVSR